jgi:hypothetical protein
MSKKVKNKNKSWHYGIVSYLIAGYVYFVGFCTKFIEDKNSKAKDLDDNHQVIYAFWHNQQSFLLFPYRKKGKISVLVSMSSDGEYIARSLPKFNMKATRGSSTRGGFAALRGLIEDAKKGYNPALTPDGPRGPIYKASPGIIYLARKTRLPIIPAAVDCSNKFHVNSWDKFQVPLPFGRCALVYEEPVFYTSDVDTQQLCDILTERLNKATEKAATICKKGK